MVESFASKEIVLVGLVNNLAHTKEILSRFEGLFVNFAEESDNSIKLVKGGKESSSAFMQASVSSLRKKPWIDPDIGVSLMAKLSNFQSVMLFRK
jgi:hypothetical protein